MPSRRMTFALNVIGIIVVAYVGILALLWRFQERIVFQPPRRPEASDNGTGMLEYKATDDVRLLAYVVAPVAGNGPVMLAFHGNAMISRWMIPWAREVARRTGATVVLPEYRGYDGLSGFPTYEGAKLDAAAALVAVRERFHVEPADMVYYGHSLGTAVATELAATNAPRALLLESPFTSARDMAARYPVAGLSYFWGFISRVHYATLERVGNLASQVHVAHGERDVIIPVRMGRQVYAAAREKGALLIVREAGHNDVADAGGDAYWKWIQGAIRPGSH
jgi:fermentation-respiration switch protein FrsA (DUF1100 family)